jgi:hypothetical protein
MNFVSFSDILFFTIIFRLRCLSSTFEKYYYWLFFFFLLLLKVLLFSLPKIPLSVSLGSRQFFFCTFFRASSIFPLFLSPTIFIFNFVHRLLLQAGSLWEGLWPLLSLKNYQKHPLVSKNSLQLAA